YKIILAFELQAIAAEINEGDSFGPRALRLLEKVAHRAAQRILIKVACADDVKAGRLQRLRNQTRVVGCRIERVRLIRSITDHERNTLLRTLCKYRAQK